MKLIHFSKLLLTAVLIEFSCVIQAQSDLKIVDGPYKTNDQSTFKQYKCPEWFRDAKFGIWSVWGPMAVPRQGDWYAKKMYQEGSKVNKYHISKYGHPSKFGFKDLIPLWKAEKWNPEYLMKLYKKAGAKYFVSIASHHDNFFLWNSKIHRWNSVEMGPHKDVIGIWQKVAKKEGLKYGVSEHLAASYTWFQTAHSADTSGDFKGVPYDGNDPAYFDLYHSKAANNDKGWLTNSHEWPKEWFDDVNELVNTYHPDLLYSDSKLPFGDTGRAMLANYYNDNLQVNHGKMEAVYNCKLQPADGTFVKDFECGVNDGISEFPWQTDTFLGDWLYRTGQKYKSSTEVIQMLVDIVSKNGNLLLDIVQTPEGEIDQEMNTILEEMATWTSINGDGIYGSRPWKVYGEGPSTQKSQAKGAFGGLKDFRTYQSTDFRFTVDKNDDLYVFELEPPTNDLSIVSLGKKNNLVKKDIASIKLLGSKEKLNWKQVDDSLIITKPTYLSKWTTLVFKIEFKK